MELPPAKGAEELLRKAIKNMNRDLLELDSRVEVYRDERFETVSDYPQASASHYRDVFPPGEEGDRQWRDLCEEYGQDPSVEEFFARNAPIAFSEGATKSPPRPLTELIAVYALADEPLDPLLQALHPDPSEANRKRIDKAVEDLRLNAGQLATLVRGGIIRRGPSTGDVKPKEQSRARLISKMLLRGMPEADLRELFEADGISRQEFTRLKNLKIEPHQ